MEQTTASRRYPAKDAVPCFENPDWCYLATPNIRGIGMPRSGGRELVNGCCNASIWRRPLCRMRRNGYRTDTASEAIRTRITDRNSSALSALIQEALTAPSNTAKLGPARAV